MLLAHLPHTPHILSLLAHCKVCQSILIAAAAHRQARLGADSYSNWRLLLCACMVLLRV